MASASSRPSKELAWDSKPVSLMSPEVSERMQSATVPDHRDVEICFTPDFLLTRTCSRNIKCTVTSSVADPDPGSDAFLTLGSGMGKRQDPDPG